MRTVCVCMSVSPSQSPWVNRGEISDDKQECIYGSHTHFSRNRDSLILALCIQYVQVALNEIVFSYLLYIYPTFQ